MATERPYLVKLVRDRVGEFPGGDGAVEYRPEPDREVHVGLLRDKLIEEALEYFKNPSVGELADVLQAVYDLAQIDLDVDRAEVEGARIDKFNERGGFLEGVCMFVTTTAPAKPPAEPRVGDLVEVVGGKFDQCRGIYMGAAAKRSRDDPDLYEVRLPHGGLGESKPVYVEHFKLIRKGD